MAEEEDKRCVQELECKEKEIELLIRKCDAFNITAAIDNAKCANYTDINSSEMMKLIADLRGVFKQYGDLLQQIQNPQNSPNRNITDRLPERLHMLESYRQALVVWSEKVNSKFDETTTTTTLGSKLKSPVKPCNKKVNLASDEKDGEVKLGLLETQRMMDTEVRRMQQTIINLAESSTSVKRIEDAGESYGENVRVASGLLGSLKRRLSDDTLLIWWAFLFFCIACGFVVARRLGFVRLLFLLSSLMTRTVFKITPLAFRVAEYLYKESVNMFQSLRGAGEATKY